MPGDELTLFLPDTTFWTCPNHTKVIIIQNERAKKALIKIYKVRGATTFVIGKTTFKRRLLKSSSASMEKYYINYFHFHVFVFFLIIIINFFDSIRFVLFVTCLSFYIYFLGNAIWLTYEASNGMGRVGWVFVCVRDVHHLKFTYLLIHYNMEHKQEHALKKNTIYILLLPVVRSHHVHLSTWPIRPYNMIIMSPGTCVTKIYIS